MAIISKSFYVVEKRITGTWLVNSKKIHSVKNLDKIRYIFSRKVTKRIVFDKEKEKVKYKYIRIKPSPKQKLRNFKESTKKVSFIE